jgi:hypothetical protein
MEGPEDFGTNIDESKNKDYCNHCFMNGMFTEPRLTMEQMVDHAAGIMAEKMGIPEEEAGEKAASFIPKLKRWQKKQAILTH